MFAKKRILQHKRDVESSVSPNLIGDNLIRWNNSILWVSMKINPNKRTEFGSSLSSAVVVRCHFMNKGVDQAIRRGDAYPSIYPNGMSQMIETTLKQIIIGELNPDKICLIPDAWQWCIEVSIKIIDVDGEIWDPLLLALNNIITCSQLPRLIRVADNLTCVRRNSIPQEGEIEFEGIEGNLASRVSDLFRSKKLPYSLTYLCTSEEAILDPDTNDLESIEIVQGESRFYLKYDSDDTEGGRKETIIQKYGFGRDDFDISQSRLNNDFNDYENWIATWKDAECSRSEVWQR